MFYKWNLGIHYLNRLGCTTVPHIRRKWLIYAIAKHKVTFKVPKHGKVFYFYVIKIFTWAKLYALYFAASCPAAHRFPQWRKKAKNAPIFLKPLSFGAEHIWLYVSNQTASWFSVDFYFHKNSKLKSSRHNSGAVILPDIIKSVLTFYFHQHSNVFL